jgi:hypothetical protein
LVIYHSEPGFIFNGKTTRVNTAILKGVDDIPEMKSFTIGIKIKMTKGVSTDQTLVGHSGC